MNSVKITYMILATIGEMFCWIMAVIAPIYFTQGLYWWTGIFVFIAVGGSLGSTKRMNSWDNFGSV